MLEDLYGYSTVRGSDSIYNAESLPHILRDSSAASTPVHSSRCSVESTPESMNTVPEESSARDINSSMDYSDTGATRGASTQDHSYLTTDYSPNSLTKCSTKVLPPLSNSSHSTMRRIMRRNTYMIGGPHMLPSGVSSLCSDYIGSLYDSWPTESSELVNDLMFLEDSDIGDTESWVRRLPDSVALRKAQFSDQTTPPSNSISTLSHTSFSSASGSAGPFNSIANTI